MAKQKKTKKLITPNSRELKKQNQPIRPKGEKPLARMTRAELDAKAKTLKINPSKFPKKGDLLKAVKAAAPAPARPRPKKQHGRKVDWNKAFDWYLEDHSRSYSDVAKEFGVNKKTVENAAKYNYTEGEKKGEWCTWAERRQELGEEARKKIEDEYKKSVPYRNREHLKLYKSLQEAAANKIGMLAKQGKKLIDPDTEETVLIQEFDARQLADVAKALKIAIEGERVVLGLPTSVSTIKPGADDETGKGWGELLAIAMKASKNEQSNT